MAERSSELERIETDENGNLLEVPERGQTLQTTGEFDADAALAETAETDDATQIRGQIEETRSQMSETIDAIQEKLSIANITEQVKDQVSEQISGAVETAKDAVYDKVNALGKSVGKSFAQIGKSDLAKKAQKNPWIFSVVGMGIGAILIGVLSGGKPKRKVSHRHKKLDVPQTRQSFASDAENDFDYQKPEGESDELLRRINTEHKEEKSASSTLAGVSSAAGSAYEGISSAAGKSYETVGKAAGKTYETVGKASGYAYEKAGNLGEAAMKNYKHYIEENPLAVGAVAVAVGAAIGYAIPLTKTENQYFGEVRDKIFDKAQASAQEAIGSVKQTVEDARQLIAEEVKSQTAAK